MDSGISITAEKLVEVTAKYASQISVKEDEYIRAVGFSSKDMGKRVVARVSFWLVNQESTLLYCRLCNKGPFTKRGMFLHLTRMHHSEIKLLLEEEIKREIKAIL
ncbi:MULTISPECIES: hypothetical protein [Metallosphaera]|uniref:Uncharacterized protein n=3 Tax=Metallosphaera TaxID=41980 RepID=A4YEI9_METS5|nr:MULTISPECIES: hypothetical protein [Metallosphaera]ABP94841.1 hypothetical protein Msed_0666 [Metallosphaera sedula DSM 5348]AIM26828.1 hypothetical protein HA72_0666 [Metallosphaera sedula]AKV73775.1 hypothetical protein MsedA_0679 [Metallosphaera sedula]AKV76015.1 hypothetical protein MsedB_0679 [Metallosphaera sedula]AKV78266.1 hypothetical protein MsedC_0678 [Metallosphaera sedula]